MLCLVDAFSCFVTWLAEYIDSSVEQFLAISFTVFRLHFVLAATRALDQLAEPAAFCAKSEFGIRLPRSAACAKVYTPASIAELRFLLASILYC